MLINYDLPKINAVLHDFYNATGTHIELFDTSFKQISNNQHNTCDYCKSIQQKCKNRDKCIAFDKVLLKKCQTSNIIEQDVCPFGLLNVVSPIIYDTTIIGYLFFGEMKTANTNVSLQNEFFDLYSGLPLINSLKIKSISNLAEILIGHILTENMLKPESNEVFNRVMLYIHNNLTENLSIKQISKHTNVSKSVLYSKFHARFNCTIGEYISKKRIEYALELLSTTSLSIEEISQKCGFSSASYFTKTFKKQIGTTPLKHKKSQA